ncbi:helix-turn-helix domain-containing protein [Miltoncostaea oceani]|uniref:helix-turn-helix domain-containing protein n=1 Tax=Miltoncostaea oceani TaxID=2843216 RepID=UPI001C3D1608|nr:helix-turn-helix transcriptional regulator [Miltoncostaea oceani]
MQIYIVKTTAAHAPIAPLIGTLDYASMPDLGSVLRRRREEAKLTRRVVAESIGETENKLYRWETGLNKPEALALLRMLVLYESSPADIIGEVEADAEGAAARPDPETATQKARQLGEKVAGRTAGRSRPGRRSAGG